MPPPDAAATTPFPVVDDERPKSRSLGEWIRHNDLIILFFVALVTVAITQLATHVYLGTLHPISRRIMGVQPGAAMPTWKLLLEFVVIILLAYVAIELVIRPQVPTSHYLLNDSVIQAKKELDDREPKWSEDVFQAPEAPRAVVWWD
jgi:hypothetical protein